MMRIRSYFYDPFPFFLFEAHSCKSTQGIEASVFEDILGFICRNSHTTFPKDFGKGYSIGYVHFGSANGFTYVGYEHLGKVKRDFINDVIHDSDVGKQRVFLHRKSTLSMLH